MPESVYLQLPMEVLDVMALRGFSKIWWSRIQRLVCKHELPVISEESVSLMHKLKQPRPQKLTPIEWTILKRHIETLLTV